MQTQCTYWVSFVRVKLAQRCVIKLTTLSGKINFDSKFSHVPFYFQICMFFLCKVEQAENKNDLVGDCVVPGSTGLVSASCSALCSAAADAELAKDIQQNTARGLCYRNNNSQLTHLPAREINLEIVPQLEALMLPNIYQPLCHTGVCRKEA